jgi:hypothetical protein
MQFQVPQFIEVEDKIFGPLTFRQFIYLAGGGGLSFICYAIFPLYVAIFLIVPIVAFSIALAFYKINNKAFIYVVEAAFQYFLNTKLYIWKKVPKKPDTVAQANNDDKEIESLLQPKLSESKLKELAWSLDIHEKVYNRTRDRNL